MFIQEDEVLGKAYDARLMRRLLGYLRAYREAVGVTLVAIIGHSMMQLAQPYLTKLVIDRHITTGNLMGLEQIALIFLVILLASFVLEYLETYTMQMIGAADHVRSADGDLRASSTTRRPFLRP